MKRYRPLLALVALLALAATVSADDLRREQDLSEKEGKPAPALAATDWMNIEGESLDLADLRGKVVVIDFWGTW